MSVPRKGLCGVSPHELDDSLRATLGDRQSMSSFTPFSHVDRGDENPHARQSPARIARRKRSAVVRLRTPVGPSGAAHPFGEDQEFEAGEEETE